MIYCLMTHMSSEEHILKFFQNEDILFISEIDNNLANYKANDIIIIESVSTNDTKIILSTIATIDSKIVILTNVPSIEEGFGFIKINKKIVAYGNRFMSKANILQLYEAVSNNKLWFYPEFMKKLKKG